MHLDYLKISSKLLDVRSDTETEAETEKSDYEKLREENIKERMEMLRSLGLPTEVKDCRNNISSRNKRTLLSLHRTRSCFTRL